VLVGALALALGVAACSGGDEPSGVASLGGAGSATGTTSAGGSQDDRQAALNWARCMRQHGIDLPDPQFTAAGIAQQLPDREVRNSAKFKAAEQACKQYLPNGGPAQRPGAPAGAGVRQVHAPARHQQHARPADHANGIDQLLPRRMDADDPRLKAAEQACHQYGSLPPPKPGGPQTVGVASVDADAFQGGGAVVGDVHGVRVAARSRGRRVGQQRLVRDHQDPHPPMVPRALSRRRQRRW
jgi:hypothetical protein